MSSKYADSPHPKVLKSRSQIKLLDEGLVAGSGQHDFPPPPPPLPLPPPPPVPPPPSRNGEPFNESLPVIMLGDGLQLMGESSTDGDAAPASCASPTAASVLGSDAATGGNAFDSDIFASPSVHPRPPDAVTLVDQAVSEDGSLGDALVYDYLDSSATLHERERDRDVPLEPPPPVSQSPSPPPPPPPVPLLANDEQDARRDDLATPTPVAAALASNNTETAHRNVWPPPPPHLSPSAPEFFLVPQAGAVRPRFPGHNHNHHDHDHDQNHNHNHNHDHDHDRSQGHNYEHPLRHASSTPLLSIPLNPAPSSSVRHNSLPFNALDGPATASSPDPAVSAIPAVSIVPAAAAADHEHSLAGLRLRNPARKSSPLSRSRQSLDAFSLSGGSSESLMPPTDQPVPELLARLSAIAEMAGNDVLRKAIAAASTQSPTLFDDMHVEPPAAVMPPAFEPQAQWDVVVMDSDGEVRLERRDASAVVALSTPSLRSLVEPGDIVVNTPDNFPDRFCVHPGNTLRLSHSSSNIEALMLRLAQGFDRDSDAHTPPATPLSSRSGVDDDVYVLFFPALGHAESESLLPVAYSYCTNKMLLDSTRGKNVQALRAAFLTLQDHLSAHLTLDAPLVSLFELEGSEYHAVHRALTATDAILLVVPAGMVAGPVALQWMDGLLGLFYTLFGGIQALQDPALRLRLDALLDLFFAAVTKRDFLMDSWDSLTAADVPLGLLTEVREALCKLEGVSVSHGLNRPAACIALGSCLVYGGVLLHSQLPPALLHHTIGILRAYSLLQPADRLSLTLWVPLPGLEDNGRPLFLLVRVCESTVLCSMVSGWNVSLREPCDVLFSEIVEETLNFIVSNESFRRLVASLRAAEPTHPLSPAPAAAAKPRRSLTARLRWRPQAPASPRAMSPAVAQTPDVASTVVQDAVLFFMACDPGSGVIVLPKIGGDNDMVSLAAFRSACATIHKMLLPAQRARTPRLPGKQPLLTHEFPLGQVQEYAVLLPATSGVTLFWVVGRLQPCTPAPLELYLCFRDGTAAHVVELAFRHLFGVYF